MATLGNPVLGKSSDVLKFYGMNLGSLDRKDKRSSWAASSITGGGSIGGESFAGVQDGVTVGNSVTGVGSSSMFDSFPPVTLTVSSFFKQVKGQHVRCCLSYWCNVFGSVLEKPVPSKIKITIV